MNDTDFCNVCGRERERVLVNQHTGECAVCEASTSSLSDYEDFDAYTDDPEDL